MVTQYNIDWSDTSDKTSFVVLPGELNLSTSLSIYGMGSIRYGEKMNENFIHLLENFSKSTPPVRPTKGQVWYDSSEQYLRIQFGQASVDLAIIEAGISAGDSVAQIKATLAAAYSPDPSPYIANATYAELRITTDYQGWSIAGGRGIATDTSYGIVRIATEVEALALTATDAVLTPYLLSLITATTTRTGIIELATPAEAMAMTDNTRAITPYSLSFVIATDTTRGLVRLATDAEALAGISTTAVITPYQVSLAVPYASTIKQGKLELATPAEANALADDEKGITPYALNFVIATDTKRGLVRLATDAEASAGTNADAVLTPYQVALAIPIATTTLQGKVELSTPAEADALVDNAHRIVTPYALDSVIATTSKQGLVTLATGVEAYNYLDPSKVVTPLALNSLIATTTKKGLVRLATATDITNEASDVAVTPSQLSSLATISSLPVGFLLSYGSTVDPSVSSNGTWVWADGATYPRTGVYATAFSRLNPDLTIRTAAFSADNLITTPSAHGLKGGECIMFTNVGYTLPGGLAAFQTYYAIRNSDTTFYLHSSPYRHASIANVNITSSSAGLFTAGFQVSAWGLGNGTTTFNVPTIDQFERAFYLYQVTGVNAASYPTAVIGAHQIDALKGHQHTFSVALGAGGSAPGDGDDRGYSGAQTTSAAGGEETRPPNRAVYKIFKIK